MSFARTCDEKSVYRKERERKVSGRERERERERERKLSVKSCEAKVAKGAAKGALSKEFFF